MAGATASGSFVLPWALIDLDNARPALDQLSDPPRLFDMSVGLQVADVRDVPGAVVV